MVSTVPRQREECACGAWIELGGVRGIHERVLLLWRTIHSGRGHTEQAPTETPYTYLDTCPGCGQGASDPGGIERLATPDEVDAGCELGIAYDPCPTPGFHRGGRS